MRQLTWVDQFLGEIDLGLRTLFPPEHRASQRPVPGFDIKESSLSIEERRDIVGMVRVNHSGEVAAQALYQGQALTAKLDNIREQMSAAAIEEIDHLAWCEKRLRDLGGETSYLTPIWYFGALFIGAMAGLHGDHLSLGFVAETEKQVVLHLEGHLDRLPLQDKKTKLLFETMLEDENIHATKAREAGGIELPFFVKQLMHWVSKIMTKTAYYL